MKKTIIFPLTLIVFVFCSCGTAREQKAVIELSALKTSDSLLAIIDSSLNEPNAVINNTARQTNTYIFEFK